MNNKPLTAKQCTNCQLCMGSDHTVCPECGAALEDLNVSRTKRKEAKVCNEPDHMYKCVVGLGTCDACDRCRCIDCTLGCLHCDRLYEESQDCKEGVE